MQVGAFIPSLTDGFSYCIATVGAWHRFTASDKSNATLDRIEGHLIPSFDQSHSYRVMLRQRRVWSGAVQATRQQPQPTSMGSHIAILGSSTGSLQPISTNSTRIPSALVDDAAVASSNSANQVLVAPTLADNEHSMTDIEVVKPITNSLIDIDANLSTLRRPHVRRILRSTCHFDPLAPVEVQSVMHMLDTLSLLRLARCNHRLRTDASTEYAWKHRVIEHSVSSCEFDLRHCRRLNRSLLRYAPIRVNWGSLHSFGNKSRPSKAEIRVLLSFRHIHQLVFTRCPLSKAHWKQVFTHQRLHRVTTVAINYNPPCTNWAEDLTGLSSLTQLCLVGPVIEHDMTQLRNLPKVTSLVFEAVADEQMEAIEQLTQLSTLDVTGPSWYGRSFLRFCRSPLGGGLRKLRVRNFTLHPPEFSSTDAIPENDILEGFPLLASLEDLSYSGDLPKLVPYLHLLPKLRRVHSQPNELQLDEATQLLARIPLLHLSLYGWECSVSTEEWDDLAKQFPGRMSLNFEPD